MSKDDKWLQKIKEAKREKIRNRAVPSLPGKCHLLSPVAGVCGWFPTHLLWPQPMCCAYLVPPQDLCPEQHCWSWLLPVAVPNHELHRLLFHLSLSLLICWHPLVDNIPLPRKPLPLAFPDSILCPGGSTQRAMLIRGKRGGLIYTPIFWAEKAGGHRRQ